MARKLNKIRIFAVIILFILVAGLFIIFFKGFTSTGSVTKEEQEPIKIGALLSLSGDAAYYGVDELKAAQLAVEEANKEGGINGRNIELVVEDIGSLNTPLALTGLRKLTDVDDVQVIIGPTWDMPGVAIAAEEMKVILISPDNTESVETEKNLQYFYSTWYPQKAESKALVGFIEQRGYKRVAIIRDQDIYSNYVFESFREAAEGKDIEIVNDFLMLTGDKDFRTTLLKIKGLQADVIFAAFADETPRGPLVRQIREFGLEVVVLGTVAVESANFLDYAEYAEGVVFYTYPKINERQAEFLLSYKERYGEEPKQSAASNAYDAASVILAALKAGARTSDEIRAYLNTHQFESVTYGILKFDEKGYVAVDAVEYDIKTIEGGRFVGYGV